MVAWTWFVDLLALISDLPASVFKVRGPRRKYNIGKAVLGRERTDNKGPVLHHQVSSEFPMQSSDSVY